MSLLGVHCRRAAVLQQQRSSASPTVIVVPILDAVLLTRIRTLTLTLTITIILQSGFDPCSTIIALILIATLMVVLLAL